MFNLTNFVHCSVSDSPVKNHEGAVTDSLQGGTMVPGLIMWLLGVPLGIVVLLWLFGVIG